jgi:hypothetical protein
VNDSITNANGDLPMNRSSFQAAVLAATFAFALALFPRPVWADGTIILKSTRSIDRTAHTATLPLYEGWVDGNPVWYIVTDASDANEARHLGVVYSPDLASIGKGALQHVAKRGARYVFDGAPDFSQRRSYVASAGGFPPTSSNPGSVGDRYSPFVRVDGIPGVLNAPIVASGAGDFDVTRHSNTEDRVIGIDTHNKTVTLVLARGFVSGRLVDYLSTEASDPVAASVERATYAPKLKKAAPSASIPIGVVVKGPRSANAGQGLAYLALDTPLGEDATANNVTEIGSPFNILSLAPDVKHPYAPNGYSPLWDVEVLPAGKARRITNFATFAALGAKPAGFVVNCPVVAYE